MKLWPVPNSFSKIIPAQDSPGCYWEDRSDRRHCGVDIYADDGSSVVSICDGKVLSVDVFTSPDRAPHWNFTYSVLIRDRSGFVFRYAELGQVDIGVGDFVKAGENIGKVGTVINPWKVSADSPEYVKCLKSNPSMLHFEAYSDYPEDSEHYIGGNWFGNGRPPNLLDPCEFLVEPVQNH